MKDIVELYNEIKNMEGVDLALIETYIKFVLKQSGCETIEELNSHIEEEQEKLLSIDSQIEEFKKELDNTMMENNIIASKKEEEQDSLRKKSALAIIICIAIMFIATIIFLIISTFPTFIIALGIILLDIKGSFHVFKKLSDNFYEIQNQLDEMSKQETTLRNILKDSLLKAKSFYNNFQSLNNIKENIVEFMESYISLRNNSQDLTQDSVEKIEIKENMEFLETPTEVPKSLHI